MSRTLILASALVLAAGIAGCSNNNKQQQPSAEEQKRIQDEQRKAAQQQRDLTNGMGQTMSEPPPGSAEYKRQHANSGAKRSQDQTQQSTKQPDTSPQQ
jgi:hypothetical protein